MSKYVPRTLRFSLCLALLLLCAGTAAPHLAQKKASKGSLAALPDAELIRRLEEPSPGPAEAAGVEIVRRGERMIPLLLKCKGNRKYFSGIYGSPMSADYVFFPTGNPSEDRYWSERGKFVTVEATALYLITAIFYDSMNISQGPFLTDLSLPEIKRRAANTDEVVKRAWHSTESWVRRLEERGMAALRAAKEAPLHEGNVRFW